MKESTLATHRNHGAVSVAKEKFVNDARTVADSRPGRSTSLYIPPMQSQVATFPRDSSDWHVSTEIERYS
ncbi:hypothetical protein TWF730_004651 [Orbilia blumenaviensis]|uniref:Uncharacterized protein n=1 Tax=Orbilia blumenaviensis TaxID=1796055 RepID=A0AAV9TZ04_9PEZI